YTATLTAPATAGAATVSATLGGTALASTAIVQFVPGAASAASSTVEVDAASLTADGTSQTTVTVKLKDAQGNALTSGGVTVGITSTLGTVSGVTDNNNGTYTATLTAPATAGAATVSATLGGTALASTAIVQFVPGAASAASSTVEVDDASLTADGTSQTTVTVKLKDAHGNALTTGGATVGITTTLGTVSGVTDNNNGTYTATLTAPATAGAATVSATLGGTALTSTAIVQFVPGAASAASSTVEVDAASLTADGTSQTTVTVKLKDAQGNALTSGGVTVGIATTSGTVSGVTDNNNGTYTATLTAPATAGAATVSATLGGTALTSTAIVQFVPGAASAASSTVEVDAASLTADGTSQTTVTVKLKDAHGNALTTGGATVGITTTLGTVSGVSDNNNGTYTAMLTASTTLGLATVSASVYGSAVISTASVQFLPGGMSASHSTVTASDLVVRADGSSKASIYVKLNDAYNHSLAGKQVTLQANGGRSVIDQVYGFTGADGIAAFSVSNTTAENVTYSAKEEMSGLTLDQTVNITFTYDQPPLIELEASPAVPTFGGVTVTVTSSVYGEFNRVASVKWAAGSRPISYFDTQGTEITSSFTVQENGIYSVYVRDTAGNTNVSLIEISNIVPLSSNASLAGWQLTGLGGTIRLDFAPETALYTVNVADSVYGLNMLLTAPDAYAVMYVNGLQVASGSVTDDYSLAMGKNVFEVRVQAQDGSVKTYTLNVFRVAADSDSDSDSSGSSGSSSSPSQPSLGQSLQIWINGTEVGGIASLQTDANKVKSIDAVLDIGTLQKVLGSLSDLTDKSLRISVQDEAAQVNLRLPGEAIKPLAEKEAVITLEVRQGQYRLPLADIVNLESDWQGSEVQITIRYEEHNEGTPGLQDAALQDGFRLIGEPVYFEVYAVHQGQKKEISTFGRYVERVIYLPAEWAGTASTAVVWNPKQGVRPVPTEFIQTEGRQAAVIRSLTNSAYALVSKASNLIDLQGHWAASEIGSLNRRMIVQGVDKSRFAPEAAITRAELAALLARALGLPESGAGAGFQDVSASSWYSGAVASVKAYGMMDGFEGGVFEPNREVSRQEAIVTLVRAMQFMDAASVTTGTGEPVDVTVYSDSSQIGGWASDSVQTAIKAGLVNGYGNELRPRQSLTRAEMTVLLYRMLLKKGFIDG
ncbi:invasin domain 3-containing protein, partial [Paenibacillus sp. y28]|uniref:invasin domain 3-containing protein n=1 Tax=Paenibacillus sp. y28 TaxID=3129110 RepID=UPI00301AAB1D